MMNPIVLTKVFLVLGFPELKSVRRKTEIWQCSEKFIMIGRQIFRQIRQVQRKQIFSLNHTKQHAS